MGGIEDFVVEQILQDFQQSPLAPQAPQMESGQVGNRQPPQTTAGWASSYSPQQHADALVAANPRSATNPDTGMPWGQYAQQYETQRVAAENKSDDQRFKVLEGLKGLDPQIQGTILKRLGIDPGPIKSTIDQQKEILAYKQQLEAPQEQMANALKMMVATQGGQHNMAELVQKQQAQQQLQSHQGKMENLSLMSFLAKLVETDTTGKLRETIGPMLMQMLQGAGVNLAPPAAGPVTPSAQQPAKNGRRIIRE